MVKVLLAIPPGIGTSKYQVSSFLNFTAPPLGLGYIAAVLEDAGFKGKVKILDSRAIGATLDTLRHVIRRWKPNIVGLQIKTPNFSDAVKATKICKEENVEYVIWGGHHASPLAEECASINGVDIVFRGEAEYTFRDFVIAIEEGRNWKNIPGITFLDKFGLPKSTPNAPLIKNINELPFPARHLLPMDKYRIFGSSFPATTMITSRGCPYNCEFCSVSSFYGAKWRTRSPENIAAEMSELADEGLMAVAFVDDLFFISRKRVYKICKAISDIRKEIYWGATIRPDRSDFKMLSTMRKTGCRLVFAGVETYDQNILDSVKKGTKIHEIEDFFHLTKKANLDTLASFSFGFPGETRDTIRKTIRWAIDVLDPSLAIFTISTPYPGTPFFSQMDAMGKITEKDYSKFTLFNPLVELNGIDRQTLKEEVLQAYKEFYLRPNKIFQNTKREFKYALESYGLRQFFFNSKVAIKGVIHFGALQRSV
ncbi:MAG: B12-binding domain-containing radical SAM protein [Candidatus Hodarchaeales archaeon]|jgi:radical SAM superfamily enzyme YgiQ (UPF0313 family)